MEVGLLTTGEEEKAPTYLVMEVRLLTIGEEEKALQPVPPPLMPSTSLSLPTLAGPLQQVISSFVYIDIA